MIKIPFPSSCLIAPILLGHRYLSSPSSSPRSPPCRPSPCIIFPFFQSHPSPLFSPPPILFFFTSSSSSFNPTLLLLQSHPFSLLPVPPIPSFSSSSSSFLCPLQLLPSSSIIDVPPPYSFPLFPFLLTPFSSLLFSSSSFPLLLQSHPSPPLLLPPPPIIPSFSSSSFSCSNPTNKAFNATLHLYTDLRDPVLSLHDGSIHLHPFLVDDPSFPPPFSPHPLLLLVILLPPPSHSFNPTILLLFFFLLQSHLSPLLLPPPHPPSSPFSFTYSSSFSSNPIHKAFNAALLQGSSLHLQDGSLHLHPFFTCYLYLLKWKLTLFIGKLMIKEL